MYGIAEYSQRARTQAHHELGPHDGQVGREEAKEDSSNPNVSVAACDPGMRHGCKLASTGEAVNRIAVMRCD